MAIKEIFESNTDKIDLATQLLSELSDREGQYVWKKYKVTEEKNKEVAITVTPVSTGNPFHLEMNSEDADLTVVDGAFFVGLKGTYGGSIIWEITSATTMLFSGTSYAIAYEPSTRKLAVHFQESSVSTWVTTNTLIRDVTMKIFDGYVTADDELSYPNGDMLDGYWYVKFDPVTLITENIREGVDIWGVIGAMSEGINLLGVGGWTRMAVDYITYSSDQDGRIKHTHSLGVIPKIGIILALDKAEHFVVACSMYVASSSTSGAGQGIICYQNDNAGRYQAPSTSISSGQSSTQIAFASSSTGGAMVFKGGVKYVLLTWG